jgi:hypothetical protein
MPLDSAVVPEWVHLLPAGKFSGADGRGPYTAHDPAVIIAASMAAGRLPVDENHATDLAAPKGGPSPARGWIVEMQVRPDGIWGRVEWTEIGRSMLAARAYRFISPVLLNDKNGTVLRILRAALTNVPNLLQLKSLNSRRDEGEAFLTTMAAQGKPVTNIREAVMICYMHDPDGTRRMVQEMPSTQAYKPTDFDRDIDGSKDIKPTAAERDIARRINIDANRLARARQEREAQQSAGDAERIREFERRTTAANNPLARQATEPSAGSPQPTPEERDVARRMGLDPTKLAQQRERKEAKDREEVLESWRGYINQGGPGDRSYELTALDRDACQKLGVDPQEFLAWKRDPISAVRPRGLPYDPGSAARVA